MSSFFISNVAVSGPPVFIRVSATIAGADSFIKTSVALGPGARSMETTSA